MTEAKKMKRQIEKRFKSYGVKNYIKRISEEADCTYESTRQWFRLSERKSDEIEAAAFRELEKVKEEHQNKSKILEQ